MNQDGPRILDREDERRQLIEELIVQEGPDWAEQHKPGSFGCHELLDRTAFAADLLERYVLAHPACLGNEDWHRLAEQAADALQELYQRVGEAHLSAQ
jgi:hypothetical protein